MLDVYIARASIRTYRSLGCHVVALKEEKDLFAAILALMIWNLTQNPNLELQAPIRS
jgi:hypothetical protein